jgi:hypothetical protein
MAKGKIPRRNHRAHSQRDVEQLIALAGILDRRGGLRKAQGFARIELKEVDSFGYVGIGFGPVLADFVRQPCAKFKFAGADDLRCVQQQRCALFDWGGLPCLEGLERGLHRLLSVLGAGFLMNADNLSRLCRVVRFDLARCAQMLASDYKLVLVAKQVAHMHESLFHGMGVLMMGKIDKRLITKFALRRTRQDDGGHFGGRHNASV